MNFGYYLSNIAPEMHIPSLFLSPNVISEVNYWSERVELYGVISSSLTRQSIHFGNVIREFTDLLLFDFIYLPVLLSIISLSFKAE